MFNCFYHITMKILNLQEYFFNNILNYIVQDMDLIFISGQSSKLLLLDRSAPILLDMKLPVL